MHYPGGCYTLGSITCGTVFQWRISSVPVFLFLFPHVVSCLSLSRSSSVLAFPACERLCIQPENVRSKERRTEVLKARGIESREAREIEK